MQQGKRFIVADVGGTKVLLYLIEIQEINLKVVEKKKFYCKNFSSFEEILHSFGQTAEALVIGAAGVIKDERCTLTNLSWVLDSVKIKQEFSFQKVKIVNDVELAARGVPFLEEKDLLVLQKGRERKGSPKSILSVGTGLGEGIIIGEDAFATEGGHCDFAAKTVEEFSFLQKMQQKYGHVSFERVLSGGGIEDIYEFFTGKQKKASEIFAGKDGLKTVAFFLKNLGREGSNLALKTLSLGGLYLTGGVLEKNFLALQRDEFLDGFLEKGRFTKMLQSIPVSLIRSDRALLEGAKVLLMEKEKV